jgi:leader peptidase (prepilin peptidase)/N-methyltransferase
MLYVWYLLVFLLGASVGSFINVAVYRLPYEKSLLWPGSRCGHCYQPIRWYDNLPLVSYWWLRGRCRSCGAKFSVRYFLVELFVGLVFAGLFHLEIVANVFKIDALEFQDFAIKAGAIPFWAWAGFAHHAALLSFLIAASVCDFDHMEIPLSLTVTGTLVGLLGATLLPWPWPNYRWVIPPPPAQPLPGMPFPVVNQNLPAGVYPWPVWFPLPRGLPAFSWQLGLITGLAGAAAGAVVMRAVRFLFGFGRGIEGLGMGDADLMMMAGAFVGWQPVLTSFFLAIFPGLFFGLAQLLLRGNQALPFGPSLAGGVVLTLLLWPVLGPRLAPLYFDPWLMGGLGIAGAFLLLFLAFLMRLVLGRPEPEQVESGS